MRTLILTCFAVLLALPAYAVAPGEALDDPALEARARAISANLRCLVCQNQSIDDSDAPLARDLRLIVRERLVAGDTNGEATQYIVDRYGEFVLLNPVVAPHTLLLWIAAPAFLAMGGIAVFFGMRRRRLAKEAGPALSDEEAAMLSELEKAPRDS